MKTFSRLSMFVFLALSLMFVGNNADAQGQGTPFLEVTGSSGFQGEAVAGGRVQVTFVAGYDGIGQPGIPLKVSAKNIRVTSPLPVPGTHNTEALGALIVSGTFIEAEKESSISVVWDISDKESLNASAAVDPNPDEIGQAIIVVNPPEPKEQLAVGDTFKQTITIENESGWATLPLSAWQMDIVFNPQILEVIAVMEGDFLEQSGHDPLFFSNISAGRISVSQALAGQTEGVASRPSPPGISLRDNEIGKLLTIEFRILTFAEEVLGIHNVQLQSNVDDDGDRTPDRISYAIKVKDVAVATHHQTYIYAKEDVNQDEMVNILDLVEVAASIGTQNPRADVNEDGFVNVLDLVGIYHSSLWAQPAPRRPVESWSRDANEDNIISAPTISRNVDPTTIQGWIDHAQVKDDGSAIFDLGIANLETLLKSRVPTKTRLLLNYPNPFNPETWIPYQLAEASNVSVTIYSTNGTPIRTLKLGHQSAGTYINKSQAAYWDGRNEFGEQAASGIYFYTFTAGKFSATGKMLIRK